MVSNGKVTMIKQEMVTTQPKYSAPFIVNTQHV